MCLACCVLFFFLFDFCFLVFLCNYVGFTLICLFNSPVISLLSCSILSKCYSSTFDVIHPPPVLAIPHVLRAYRCQLTATRGGQDVIVKTRYTQVRKYIQRYGEIYSMRARATHTIANVLQNRETAHHSVNAAQ